MRLTVKNLGVISKAEIDLSKDLILLTGENNTGKTYLAYVIYGVFSPYWIDNSNVIQWTYAKEDYGLSSRSETWEFNILDKFKEIISYSLKFSIPIKFAVRTDFFKDLELSVSCEENSLIAQELLEWEISESEKHEPNPKSGDIIGYESYIEKKENSLNVKISAKSTENALFPKKGIEVYFLARKFRELIQQSKSAVFIPTERTGINLFHKELSLIKNKTFDSLLSNGKSQELLSFFNTRFNKYPKPIKDALETAQNLDAIQKQKSEYAYLADEMEANFMGGKVQMNDDGDIQFRPDNSDKSLEIHLASSSVKSLATLSIYLRHIAKKGDFIIIDEPEANLHPNNQIKIARFLARLVNEGFKVMVSTHSDYIARELNSLIMLGSGKKKDPETTKGLLKKYKEYQENQFLSHDQVGVYMFRQGKDVEGVKVDEAGFEIATIDETVERLNETSQNIYYELFD
ncbi:MAG: AAA family ATPase [Saprospiraceae bacterium]